MNALRESPIVEIRNSFISIAMALGVRALKCKDFEAYREWQNLADKAALWSPSRGYEVPQ
jgi:hypothetical protein